MSAAASSSIVRELPTQRPRRNARGVTSGVTCWEACSRRRVIASLVRARYADDNPLYGPTQLDKWNVLASSWGPPACRAPCDPMSTGDARPPIGSELTGYAGYAIGNTIEDPGCLLGVRCPAIPALMRLPLLCLTDSNLELPPMFLSQIIAP